MLLLLIETCAEKGFQKNKVKKTEYAFRLMYLIILNMEDINLNQFLYLKRELRVKVAHHFYV